MDLQEFVSGTLKQIVDSVIEANKYLKGKGGKINPFLSGDIEFILKKGHLVTDNNRSVHMVEFDVALTATEGKGTKSGIGVFLGSVGLGSQGQSNQENSSTSRVKFSVPVSLPSTS